LVLIISALLTIATLEAQPPAAPAAASRPVPQPSTSRWDAAMSAFAAADREHPPEPGAVLFVGSSSIRLWDLAASFPGRRVTNRGFGGSQISDAVEHFERLVPPHRPSAIVFYAGDNDVAAGEDVAAVVADFRRFFTLVQERLPGTPVLFVGIKPSLARWELVAPMREVNREVAAWSAREPLLTFVDVDTPMLGADGKPRPELFVDDGLHLTIEGYRLWTELVAPLLP
jgi:lysophospholipase L1-like esterase